MFPYHIYHKLLRGFRWAVFARKHKIKLIYKSGRTQTIRVRDFTIKPGGNTFEWDSAWPQPMRIGVGEIVAVYEV